jgi:hypothetical protein
MHYDNRPQDTEDGKNVMDIEFNDGSVKRTLQNGEVVILGKALRGKELLNQFIRNQ